jgi:hypothetical protein
MDSAIRVAHGQVLLSAGCSGPFWHVTQGVFKLERHGHDGNTLVQLAHLLQILGRQADGRMLPLQRKALPTLKEMARVVDARLETVCRELNTLLPEHAARASKPSTAWIGHLPFALAA